MEENVFWIAFWKIVGTVLVSALFVVMLFYNIRIKDELDAMVEIQKAGGDPARVLCAQSPNSTACGILLNTEKR